MPKAPPNHSGFNVVEEARIHKGLYESRRKQEAVAVARARQEQRRLEARRLPSNSHQGPAEVVVGREHGGAPQPGQENNLEYSDQGGGEAGGPRAQQQQQVPVYYMQDQQPALKLDPLNETPTSPPVPYIPQQRLVHLDLKGAPPTMEFLRKVLVMAQGLGATGVLLEWEDMFPWTGRLAVTAASNHYSRQEVKELLAHCEALGLEVIPLVQTFGHLEYVLKHKEFAYLRDVAEMPESLCPCHNDTMGLVREIVDQVMAVHHKTTKLHIGCDEVYHLGECAECQGAGRNTIFTDHVVRVAQYAATVHKVTPIIWDDMLRNLMEEEMQPLGGLVEPMVWVYAEDVYRFVPSYTWDRYAEVFPYMWTASAFKGAHGETLVVPDVKRHLTNNLNWISLMGEQEQKLKGGFRGIALTGWQRYDHFSVLCELLPAGVPSLAVNLVATTHGYFNASLAKPLVQGLGCGEHGGMRTTFVDLDTDNFLWDKMSWCFFPGSNFFKVTKLLVRLENDVEDFFKKVQRKKGWLTDYNIRHNMSSPFRIDELMEDWSRTHHEVVSLMRSSNGALSEMFDRFTVAEWVEQKLYPMYSRLSALRQQADSLRRVTAWPSR
jgi:hexosaminidase